MSKDCPECGAKESVEMNRYCGAKVCFECDAHIGLDRCYCGWSRSGGNGYNELLEMGEQIEEDY